MHVVKRADAAKQLLGAGARLDVEDIDGLTPLMKVEWSKRRIDLAHAKFERLKNSPVSTLSYSDRTVIPDLELEQLENRGLKDDVLVNTLNEMRTNEVKAIARLLREAGEIGKKLP